MRQGKTGEPAGRRTPHERCETVPARPGKDAGSDDKGKPAKRHVAQEEHLAKASPQLKERHEAVRDHTTDLGDDAQARFAKNRIAFQRPKNCAMIRLQTRGNSLLPWLPPNPDDAGLVEGFARDMPGVGHHGAGDMEPTVRSPDDLNKAKPLTRKSFEEN